MKKNSVWGLLGNKLAIMKICPWMWGRGRARYAKLVLLVQVMIAFTMHLASYKCPYVLVLLLWIFYVFVLSCVCYVLCASVYMCFVVTCWERADFLALVCGVFCEFVTFPLVSWVRCGT